MLSFFKYEWSIVRAVIAETNRIILARSVWIVATAVISALLFGLQQGSLQNGVSVALVSGIGTAATSYVVVWFVSTFRVPFLHYKQITPKFEIVDYWVHETEEKTYGKNNVVVDRCPSKYIQVKVVNCGVQSIACRPYLLKLEKCGPNDEWQDTGYDHSQELWWSMTGDNELSLDNEVPRLFNVMRCKKTENRLRFELGMPSPIPTFRYFNEQGSYRLTVGVAATNMATQMIVLEVDNTGEWEDFAVERIN